MAFRDVAYDARHTSAVPLSVPTLQIVYLLFNGGIGATPAAA